MKTGRPTKYSKLMADTICDRIATGETARAIARDPEMPALSSIFRWLNKHQYFWEQYTQACATRAEYWADEILDIADDASADRKTVVDDQGNEKEVANNELVNRSRLRVDTRKWLMGKMQPKKYSDKLSVDHSGEIKTIRIKTNVDE